MQGLACGRPGHVVTAALFAEGFLRAITERTPIDRRGVRIAPPPPAVGPPRSVVERRGRWEPESLEHAIRRRMSGRRQDYPVLVPLGQHGAEVMSARKVALFARWWGEVAERPAIIRSCFNLRLETEWHLWRAGVSSRSMTAMPWSTGILCGSSRRSVHALLRIARKLGRRSRTFSRSQMTRFPPDLLCRVGGRDLVRLSRFGAPFLRWLCAVDRHEITRRVDRRAANGILLSISYRIVWEAVARLAVEHRDLVLPHVPALQQAKVPMRFWSEDSIVALWQRAPKTWRRVA